MSRDKTIKFLRTTKSNLDTQKAGNNLIEGEPYFITDEERLAIGTGVGSYSEMAKKSEVDSKKSDSVSATSRVLGRKTAGSGVIEELTVDEVLAFLADNTSNDVSISKHGLVPKAPNDTTKFLRGDGTWNVPSGGGTTIYGKINSSSFNTTSASYVDVTGLSASVTANKKYFVTLYVLAFGASTGQCYVTLSCPSSTDIKGYHLKYQTGTHYHIFASNSTSSYLLTVGDYDNTGGAYFSGIVSVYYNGSVKIQIRNNDGSGQNVQVSALSFLNIAELS